MNEESLSGIQVAAPATASKLSGGVIAAIVVLVVVTATFGALFGVYYKKFKDEESKTNGSQARLLDGDDEDHEEFIRENPLIKELTHHVALVNHPTVKDIVHDVPQLYSTWTPSEFLVFVELCRAKQARITEMNQVYERFGKDIEDAIKNKKKKRQIQQLFSGEDADSSSSTLSSDPPLDEDLVLEIVKKSRNRRQLDTFLRISKEEKAKIPLRLTIPLRSDQRRRLFVSMTTSPDRICIIPAILKAIDLSNVERVYVNVPDKFGPTGEEFVIPDALSKMAPKVFVNRFGEDLGPISKLVPTVDHLKGVEKIERNATIVTIDDDIFLPINAVDDLATLVEFTNGRAAIGRSGQNIKYWARKVDHFDPPYLSYKGHFMTDIAAEVDRSINDLFEIHRQKLERVDVLEGFCAVAYPIEALNTKWMKRANALSKACKMSDDVVISWCVHQNGFLRLRTAPKGAFFEIGVGLEEEALHNRFPNNDKYPKAISGMLEEQHKITALAASGKTIVILKPPRSEREIVEEEKAVETLVGAWSFVFDVSI